jgi:hypothetical protein
MENAGFARETLLAHPKASCPDPYAFYTCPTVPPTWYRRSGKILVICPTLIKVVKTPIIKVFLMKGQSPGQG